MGVFVEFDGKQECGLIMNTAFLDSPDANDELLPG